MPKTKTKFPKDYLLNPFIAFTQEPGNEGAKRRLTEKVDAKLKRKIHRSKYNEWLDPNEDERVSPSLATGQVIVACANEVMAEMEAERAAAKKGKKK